MPPKKGTGPSKKTVEKAKAKVIEDKTFGMKNKNKSKKTQQYIDNLAKASRVTTGKKEKTFEEKQKIKAEEERKKLEQDIIKPVVQAKVPVGVDPKSIVCEFFKMGMCAKGDKCKYSHNLEQARKSEKIDIYTDRRKVEEENMDTWDQDKLEKVIESRHGGSNKLKTTIVCKYFLEAIEQKKYGFFWECPNGADKCMYMHCLPPGYVLKIKETKKEEEEEEIPIEDVLEDEKAKITTRTPLTLDLFLKWKEDKKKERAEKEEEERKKKESDIRSGKAMRSGRDLFVYNPNLFVDDENVMNVEELEPEKDETPVINIEVSGTSIRTVITNGDGAEENEGKQEDGENSGNENNDENNESGDENVAVNEELFNEDDVPDVDDIDE